MNRFRGVDCRAKFYYCCFFLDVLRHCDIVIPHPARWTCFERSPCRVPMSQVPSQWPIAEGPMTWQLGASTLWVHVSASCWPWRIPCKHSRYIMLYVYFIGGFPLQKSLHDHKIVPYASVCARSLCAVNTSGVAFITPVYCCFRGYRLPQSPKRLVKRYILLLADVSSLANRMLRAFEDSRDLIDRDSSW